MGVWAHHIDIARSPFLFAQNKRALRQLLWLVHRFRIQAIHCHTPVGGVLGRLAGRLCEGQRPVVMYTAHGFHFYKGAPVFNWLTYYQVERLLARDTDVLIVINEEDYQAARTFAFEKEDGSTKSQAWAGHGGVPPLIGNHAERSACQAGVADKRFFPGLGG